MATNIPTVPNYAGEIALRSNPENFPQNAEDQYSYLATFSTDLNSTVTAMNTVTAETEQTALSASTSADIAASNANFDGLWPAKTGSKAPPYSVSNKGRNWQLLVDIADITASEPQDGNPDWQELTTGTSDLQAAALSVGVAYSDIIYSTDLVSPIPSNLFKSDEQIIYSVPTEAQGKFIQSVVGGVLTTNDSSVYTLASSTYTNKGKAIQFANYLPDSADENYLADSEFAKALVDCVANGSRSIYLAPSLKFKLSETELSKDTVNFISIWSDTPASYDEGNTPLIMTDGDRVFSVGVDDGNPDETGFTRSITLENIQLGTANDDSDVAVNVVNTTHFRMIGCRTFGFAQGVLRSEGGNVLVDIDDVEGYGITGRNAVTGVGRGIVMGAKYWGVFVLNVNRFHTFQYKYAVGLGKGRGIKFTNVTAENLQHSVYELPNRGDEIFSLTIRNGYSELIPQYIIHDNSFTGVVYGMHIDGYEAHECPGKTPVSFSNMNRSRVLNYKSCGIIMANPVIDSQLGTSTDGRFQSVSEFSASTTVAPRANTFKDEQYEFRRYYENMGILNLAGNFSALDVDTPHGWTYINGVWEKSDAPVRSGVALKCSTGGNYSKASVAVPLSSSSVRFACAVTYNGDIAVKANGVVVLGKTGTTWDTEIFTFVVSSANPSFDIVVGPVTNAGDSIEIAEFRLWEITSSDGTEVGWTSGLTQSAIKSALCEGFY